MYVKGCPCVCVKGCECVKGARVSVKGCTHEGACRGVCRGVCRSVCDGRCV